MKYSNVKLIVLSLLFLVCSCIQNTNEAESYLPSEKTLKKGVVNKYYLKTISKEGHAEKLDIEYSYLQTKTLLDLNSKKSKVTAVFNKAKELCLRGSNNRRPYVEEFYQIYMEDLNNLEKSIIKS